MHESNGFSERLKELMKDKELNVNQLSKKIDYDFQAVARWLEGTYYPRHYVLIDLANFFDCAIDYLLGLSENDEYILSNPQSNFQERLNLCLTQSKLSRYRLSKLSKVGESAISKWINQGTFPETSTLITLAQVFDCSVDFLLGRTDN